MNIVSWKRINARRIEEELTRPYFICVMKVNKTTEE